MSSFPRETPGKVDSFPEGLVYLFQFEILSLRKGGGADKYRIIFFRGLVIWLFFLYWPRDISLS